MPVEKKSYTQPQLARLARFELDEQCEAWGLSVPPRALDLERRAMLARKLCGGLPVCLQCAVAVPKPPEPEAFTSAVAVRLGVKKVFINVKSCCFETTMC